jgi:hypothetical protein
LGGEPDNSFDADAPNKIGNGHFLESGACGRDQRFRASRFRTAGLRSLFFSAGLVGRSGLQRHRTSLRFAWKRSIAPPGRNCQGADHFLLFVLAMERTVVLGTTKCEL